MSYNMASDETDVSHTGLHRGPHLHFQGRLPGGGDARAEPITPHKSKLLGGGLGIATPLLPLQAFLEQPQLRYCSPLPPARRQGSKRCPADPSLPHGK